MKGRIKQFLLSNSPAFLLTLAKYLKKNQRRKYLEKQKQINKVIAVEKLVDDLQKIGLKKDDVVLVHCSLSKIGYVEHGPKDIVDAIEKVIGKEGTLLMPSFPAKGRNKDYLESKPVFDINNTPSQMGAVTEYFRVLPNVKRSFHPTDPVCARGKLAEWITDSHFDQLSPYNESSPFRKLCEYNGKILMLGTTLNGACTNLHTLEDAVDFKYPVYDEKIFEVQMIDEYGKHHQMKTKVHNPIYSAKRNNDELKPLFESEYVLLNGKVGEADSMLIDAKKLLDVMMQYYYSDGVTMYTPHGENGKLYFN